MYVPATTTRQRDAIRAGHEARSEAIAEFWNWIRPRRK